MIFFIFSLEITRWISVIHLAESSQDFIFGADHSSTRTFAKAQSRKSSWWYICNGNICLCTDTMWFKDWEWCVTQSLSHYNSAAGEMQRLKLHYETTKEVFPIKKKKNKNRTERLADKSLYCLIWIPRSIISGISTNRSSRHFIIYRHQNQKRKVYLEGNQQLISSPNLDRAFE